MARSRIARHETMPAAVGDAAQRDVLRDGQRGGVLELLEDDGHAKVARLARREHGVADAVDDHRPGVGLVVAGDDLDERGLAGAVLAQQGEHGATGGVEVHAMEDLDAAEGLADLASLELEASWARRLRAPNGITDLAGRAWPDRSRGCCPGDRWS